MWIDLRSIRLFSFAFFMHFTSFLFHFRCTESKRNKSVASLRPSIVVARLLPAVCWSIFTSSAQPTFPSSEVFSHLGFGKTRGFP